MIRVTSIYPEATVTHARGKEKKRKGSHQLVELCKGG
jgi:hypothetical protein